MAEIQLPVTLVTCDGCGEELSLLNPYLNVALKPKRDVIMSSEVGTAEDMFAATEQTLYLGSRSGRGVMLRFHDFDCLGQWVEERSGLLPKLEPHAEDEIYVPEDNPTEEEMEERLAALERGDEK